MTGSLPHVDEHSRQVDADRRRLWEALVGYTRSWVFARGFSVREWREGELLALHGRHPFSRYELIFELEDAGHGRSRLRAVTNAAFPGLHGRAYRALVIGTGGHRILVRRLLRDVARRA